MYHPEVIEKKILSYKKATGKDLIRYPIDQVRHYVNHFENLTVRDKKTKKPIGFSRKLQPDEVTFMENERMLCSFDFNYELERYEFVEDVITGELHLMSLNKAQQVALKMIQQLELKGAPIMLLFLKARQLGVSTLFAKIIKHRMNFMMNTQGVVASGDEAKTRTLVEKMIEKSQTMLPWWLVRPDITFNHSGDEFMTIPSANSLLLVQHGRQELGIARGDTRNTWHFTELLEWLNPKATLEAGFNKAVHPSARTFGVEETTASNRGSWLHRYWEETSVDYENRISDRYPMFLPYFIGDDIYPPPGYVPIKEGWEPSPLVKAHAANCERYVHDSKLLREVLGSNWKMPDRQMWWYENEYRKASKDPEKFGHFLAECPANPQEAFQSKSKSIIEITKLQELQRSMEAPYCGPIYVKGPEIPTVNEPSIEPEVLEITYHSHGLSRQWTLHEGEYIPIEDIKQPQHKLWIWEPPQTNHKYVIGVDCGMGVGKDRTVVQVVRLGTKFFPAKQVAEFSSDLSSAFDVTGLVLMLLTWYSPKNFNDEIQWAIAAPEDAADGKTLINELRKWGWPEIYIRQRPEDRTKGSEDGSLLGWHTDQASRPILIDWFLKFIKENRIQINSPWLLDEIRTFVMLEKSSKTSGITTYKIQHDRDAWDDRIFALAIAIVCGHGINLLEDIAASHWNGVASANQVILPNHNIVMRLRIPGEELLTLPVSEDENLPLPELPY